VTELLRQAERLLLHNQLDAAERLFREALAADPGSSIAVVGLARVALERGDDRGALELARRASKLDPENVVAGSMARRLEEVLRYRGELTDPR
jgi:predicted Zn-dependent protease